MGGVYNLLFCNLFDNLGFYLSLDEVTYVEYTLAIRSETLGSVIVYERIL